MNRIMRAPRVGALVVAAWAMVCMLGWARAADEVDLDALKARFQARHERMMTLKQQGLVGETWRGYAALTPRGEEELAGPRARERREEVQKLLAEENADRKTLYAHLARQEGTTTDQVARQNAVLKFKKAGPDERFQDREGRWWTKREMLEAAEAE